MADSLRIAGAASSGGPPAAAAYAGGCCFSASRPSEDSHDEGPQLFAAGEGEDGGAPCGAPGEEGGGDSAFKILIATDTHLGFKGEDPVRGNDSFRTFEEVLQIGRREKVDFVLHAGDLFDENKPNRTTL